MLHFIYCNAECHYAECHYAECRGTSGITWKYEPMLKKLLIAKIEDKFSEHN